MIFSLIIILFISIHCQKIIIPRRNLCNRGIDLIGLIKKLNKKLDDFPAISKLLKEIPIHTNTQRLKIMAIEVF